MMMTPGFRKVVLTMHVTSSIGWFGAVAAFLALAIMGLTSHDAQLVRAAYLAMEAITRFVIVPLAFVSLLSGWTRRSLPSGVCSATTGCY
jgi:hypothetical protein